MSLRGRPVLPTPTPHWEGFWISFWISHIGGVRRAEQREELALIMKGWCLKTSLGKKPITLRGREHQRL